MAQESKDESTADGLRGPLLLALIALAEVAWIAAFVYLGLRYL